MLFVLHGIGALWLKITDVAKQQHLQQRGFWGLQNITVLHKYKEVYLPLKIISFQGHQDIPDLQEDLAQRIHRRTEDVSL